MIEAILESPTLPLFLLLPPLVMWWIELRRVRRAADEDARARNNEALLCKHGAIRGRNCRPCAEEFEREALAERQADQARAAAITAPIGGFQNSPTRESASPSPTDAAASSPACTSGGLADRPHRRRSKYLRIDLPPQAGEVLLELHTSADWPGTTQEFAVFRENGMVVGEFAGVPACAYAWTQCLTQRYGYGIRALLLPDCPGLTRVRILINGQAYIDATPQVLEALQELRR